MDAVSYILKKSILLITLTTLLNSCGLNDSKPKDVGVYNVGNLSGSCELDTAALKKILEKDITADINCLQSNLKQFADFVRRSDSKLIAREDLSRFMLKFFPESKEIAGDLLKLVFNINTLILRDPVDHIKVEKLPAFFGIVKAINKEGRLLFQTMRDINGVNYWDKRQSIFYHIESLARTVIDISNKYTNHTDYNYQLNMESFLLQLKGILKLSDETLNMDHIRPWFFIKKLFLGGHSEEVTSQEFMELLDRASVLVITAFDGLYAFKRKHDDINTKYYYYFSIIEDLRKNIKDLPEDEVLLTSDQLFSMVGSFLSNEDSVKDLEGPITRLKEKFIGGKIDEILYKDLDKVISWLEEFTGMLYYNAVTYDKFKNKMKSPRAITGLQRPSSKLYFNINQKYLNIYWEQFEYISKNYRFFQDSDGRAYLYNYYKRFKSGFQTTSMVRWLIHKVVTVYGHYPKGKSTKHVDKADFNTAMNDVKGIVEYLGFWPDDPQVFISEAIASADLFMWHSDGNKNASQEELTEYVDNVINSFSITSHVHDHLKQHCDIVDPDKESMETTCFREYFLHVFFNELKLQKYYNKLYDFLRAEGAGTLQKYLINVEMYSRLTPDEKIPLSKEDINRIIVILTNLETAFIRFDINKNSVLERGELDIAFLVFKNLVKDVAEMSSANSPLYKSIFLYLVKYMEKPSAAKLLWFHMFGKKKNITSTRLNISAILKSFTI